MVKVGNHQSTKLTEVHIQVQSQISRQLVVAQVSDLTSDTHQGGVIIKAMLSSRLSPELLLLTWQLVNTQGQNQTKGVDQD